ncbi:MAG: SDR family oxidoreductase [Anaerolineaceae bacterium]|nr:SDR family oxidoreductase [Anaerolineaceae bacterium]
MKKLLKEKVTLVTGSGRGWGRSIARAFAAQGAKVIVTSEIKEEVNESVETIKAENGFVVGKVVDLTKDGQIHGLVDDILNKFGNLDVLVNNAARRSLKTFKEMTFQDFEITQQVNIRSAVLMCKLLLPQMIHQGGASIINVSSNAGLRGRHKEVDYSTSKFAVEGFTQALAVELKEHNIAVNAISPGGMDAEVFIKPTDMTQQAYESLNEIEKSKWTDSLIMTEAFVYLAMQRGEGITGERILALALSERIRKEGWGLKFVPMDRIVA